MSKNYKGKVEVQEVKVDLEELKAKAAAELGLKPMVAAEEVLPQDWDEMVAKAEEIPTHSTPDRKIVGVKELAAEFGMQPKRLRSFLRESKVSTKPTDGTSYQWYHDSKELAAIKDELKDKKSRKGIIR